MLGHSPESDGEVTVEPGYGGGTPASTIDGAPCIALLYALELLYAEFGLVIFTCGLMGLAQPLSPLQY